MTESGEMVIFLLSVERAPYENFAEFVRKSAQKVDISVRRDAETDTIVISNTSVPIPRDVIEGRLIQQLRQ